MKHGTQIFYPKHSTKRSLAMSHPRAFMAQSYGTVWGVSRAVEAHTQALACFLIGLVVFEFPFLVTEHVQLLGLYFRRATET